jgi:zinc and cadmium transporter
MSPELLLLVYCVVIIAASLAGGWIPTVVRLTHRRTEVALSFVSGVMLGVALLHLLPHALAEYAHAVPPGAGAHAAADPVVRWVVVGFVAMFLIERYFCFHHHDAPDASGEEAGHGPGCGHGHSAHRLRWRGAAVGLTLHTLIAGVALAASVKSCGHGDHAAPLAGFGTFLLIVLHKPFDALTIATLMVTGKSSRRACAIVNGLFSLAIPIGAALFLVGVAGAEGGSARLVGAALAFSCGTFLCIALSDVLPELQFHRHDRLLLSSALILGLAVAAAVGFLEAGTDHTHAPTEPVPAAHDHP